MTVLLLFTGTFLQAQNNNNTPLLNHISADTIGDKLNMDALYNRPFLAIGKTPIAIGGYMEANSQFEQSDGVNSGLSFQMRRMSLFFSSSIARRIRFLSEIEFENGTEEINIESAVTDIALHPAFNLRGGIILNPIGAFNQNHDGPRWDFVDRPLSATTILPATMSNVGFGAHGKFFLNRWTIGYEAYLTNGFDDHVIDNDLNRTALKEGLEGPKRFNENTSGRALFSGKIALRNRKIGELGISYFSGVYNTWQQDGTVLDEKRRASAWALDFSTALFKNRVTIMGEYCQVTVDIPRNYLPMYGSAQAGAYMDVVGTVLQRRILGWDNAKLNVGLRLDYADYNLDKFEETGGPIADYRWALTPSLSFRPVGPTVIRFNYRIERTVDFIGNPAARTGVVQLGVSTYF